ncbi:hypothetical protein [Secundilactobacillus collinoides]|nr:hypothetical protein [Secundilactobacillus collinoides]KZL42846.1 transglycosylase [Secundilactobacillus collinoides]
MSKIHIKLVTAFLLVFGFTAGMVTDTASNFNNEPTTAQASTKLTATQKKEIKAINSGLSSTQKSAKNWIAYHESSYSYTARNGNCYGRYQLLISYLKGNLSPVNQEKTANTYVKGRYGTWTKAKKFWVAHHWY